jgi:hypothetical protein
MQKNRRHNIKQRAKTKTDLNAEVLDAEKRIPIVRTKDDETILMFSDGLLVQNRDDNMFTWSFFQTQYPLVSSQSEANMVESVEQLCICQIVVSPTQMAKNIKALNDNFKRYVLQLPSDAQKSLYELAGFIEKNKEAENNGNDSTAQDG